MLIFNGFNKENKGEWIMNKYRKWRLERGLTVKEFCKLMKISNTTLWKLEKGDYISDRVTVYVDTIIKKIAEVE
jgi:DNA-binding XRE family transcriptional regulator